MNSYPTISDIRKMLRYNLIKPIYAKVLEAFIVGSEAKGISKGKSDLDIAVIIPKLSRKTSLQFTEEYHSHFISEFQKPKWENRIVDFQFFFSDDYELKQVVKIKI